MLVVCMYVTRGRAWVERVWRAFVLHVQASHVHMQRHTPPICVRTTSYIRPGRGNGSEI